jgi:hypothetical protein
MIRASAGMRQIAGERKALAGKDFGLSNPEASLHPGVKFGGIASRLAD